MYRLHPSRSQFVPFIINHGGEPCQRGSPAGHSPYLIIAAIVEADPATTLAPLVLQHVLLRVLLALSNHTATKHTHHVHQFYSNNKENFPMT